MTSHSVKRKAFVMFQEGVVLLPTILDFCSHIARMDRSEQVIAFDGEMWVAPLKAIPELAPRLPGLDTRYFLFHPVRLPLHDLSNYFRCSIIDVVPLIGQEMIEVVSRDVECNTHLLDVFIESFYRWQREKVGDIALKMKVPFIHHTRLG